jgi:hypothetical protein
VEGPTHARFIASKLWDGEEYILSIDAHTKLVENWGMLRLLSWDLCLCFVHCLDEKLIEDYTNLKFPSEEIKNQWIQDPPRYFHILLDLTFFSRLDISLQCIRESTARI